jgi:hypothetical protein
LHFDTQRIANKAYPGARNETADLIARDALLDAMYDKDIALRIRELDTSNIDQAYKHAVRLSAIRAQRIDIRPISRATTSDVCASITDVEKAETSEISTCSRLRDSGTQKSHDGVIQLDLDRLAALESKLLENSDSAGKFTPHSQFQHSAKDRFTSYSNRQD